MFAVPGVCSVIMGIVTWAVYTIVYTLAASNIIAVIAALIFAMASYFGPVFIFRKMGLY